MPHTAKPFDPGFNRVKENILKALYDIYPGARQVQDGIPSTYIETWFGLDAYEAGNLFFKAVEELHSENLVVFDGQTLKITESGAHKARTLK